MDEREKKREKGKGRDASSCRTMVASSMLLQVGFEELHKRRKDQLACSGSPSPAFLLWVGNTTLPVSAGWQPARPRAGSRERAGRGCLHDTARLRGLADPDLHATPTRSIWREEEQKALPAQGSPRCAQRHSCGGLNAVRVRWELLLPLTSLQVPGPSLSMRRKSPGRPVTEPSDRAFPRRIAPCLLLLPLLLPLPPDVSALPGPPRSGNIIPVCLVAAPRCCC